MEKNIIKPLIALGLLLIGIIAGYMISHTNLTTPATTTDLISPASSPAVSPSASSAPSEWPTYRNNQFGFSITFPQSWKGYTVVYDFWNGDEYPYGNNVDSTVRYTGPAYLFINPKKSSEEFWQNIPVWIFTKDQWKLIQQGKFIVGAAPFEPIEIGHNNTYFFTLPPRWVGYDGALGQEEAEQIIKTFKAFDPPAWQTYRNERYGYEIKYPINYQVYAPPNVRYGKHETATPMSTSIVVENENSLLDGTLRISVTENISLSYYNPPYDQRFIDNSETVFLDNPSQKLVYDANQTTYRVSRNNNIYEISIFDPHNNMDQILSTFRFLQ